MNNMKQTQDDRTIQPFNCSTIQRVKAYAFTLAETLIVIGIIGVVAALTLPNLNHATGDKEKVTKVKKIYSALTEAVDRAQAVYGDCDTWFTDLEDYHDYTERAAKRITEFMKVSKDCGFGEGCWSTDFFKFSDGQSSYEKSYVSECENYCYMVNLADGTSLAFLWTEYIRIKVDIDGPNKGKTQMGNDLFEFKIGLGSDATSHAVKKNQLTPDGFWSNTPNDYVGFTHWVIEQGNLDYLKADSTGKCNDSNIVLDGVNNTSCH